MIIILLYFFLLIIILFPLGIGTSKLLSIKVKLPLDIVLLGLVTITIFSSLWMFFLPLAGLWSFSLIFLSTVVFFYNRAEVYEQLKISKNNILKLSFLNKLTLLFTLLAIVYCTSLPAYVIDNESYYIQTIKWLDKYGLVKGLANLHVYLAQQSGFHILEAALNFDSVYDRFNDLSAFYLLIGVVWSLESDINDNYILKYYRKGLVVLSLICFTFISAPSPDTAVYVLTYILIYKFLKLWHHWDEKEFIILTFFCCQIIYFKVIMVLLFILVIMIWLKYYQVKKNVSWMPVGLLFLSLFIGKNLVVTGLPLFPLDYGFITETVWELPLSVSNFYNGITKAQAFGVSPKVITEMNAFELSQSWFFHSGLEGLLNKILLLSILISFIFLITKKVKPAIKCVIIVFLFHVVVLFVTSPQFRFFIPLLVPSAVLSGLLMFKLSHKTVNFLILTFLFVGLIIATFTGLQNRLTDNDLMIRNYNLHALNLLIQPAPKSIYPNDFKKVTKNELQYHSPLNNSFLYGTYDLPLPAVNERYVEFMENKYQISIQKLGDSISEGFKYVKIKN